MTLVAKLNALASAVAELARYGNHDSHCAWVYSMTNPRAVCSCGFDDAVCTVSNFQDDLMKVAVAANTCQHDDQVLILNQSGTTFQCKDCTEVFTR